MHLTSLQNEVVLILCILFLCKNDKPWFLINCSSYTLLECLTNWLPEVDCECILSVMCHEKYSELFSTLKCLIRKCIAKFYWLRYSTDLTQHCTREWYALESNPLSTKILSIHHRVLDDALVKYARRKHSQQALTEYLISNS